MTGWQDSFQPDSGAPSAGWQSSFQPEAPGLGEDLAKSVAFSGTPRGVMDLAGMGGNMFNMATNLGSKAGHVLWDPLLEKIGVTPPQGNPFAHAPDTSDVQNLYTKAGGELYQPQTDLGKIASKATEYATGASLGAPEGMLARAGIGAASGVGDEVLGQAYQGSPYEGAARFIGSLLGGGAGIAGSELARSAPSRGAQKALAGVTDAQFQAAQALQKEAAAAGIPITAPEAIASVTGDNKDLLKLQAKIESTKAGKQIIAPMMQQRATGNEAAITGALGDIGPGINDANTLVSLPHDVQGAAKGALGEITGQRSAQTSPLYEAATQQAVAPGALDDVLSSIDKQIVAIGPTTDAGKQLLKLRGQITANTPQVKTINTGILDANGEPISRMIATEANLGPLHQVFKEQRDLLNAKAEQPNALGSAVKGVVAPENRAFGAQLENINPVLQQANALHAQLSQDIVNPVQRGPIGSLADINPESANPITRQFQALVDSENANPAKIREAAAQLAAQDPNATRNLLASGLQNEWDKANTMLPTGPNINAGAKFAASVNTPKIKAFFDGIPDGKGAYAGFKKLINGLQAQGQRLDPSTLEKTTVPTAILRSLSSLKNPLGATADVLNLMTGAGNREFARTITAPEGVMALRKLAGMNPESPKAQALMISLLLPKQAAPTQNSAMPSGGVPQAPIAPQTTPIPPSVQPQQQQVKNEFGNSPDFMASLRQAESGGKDNAKNPFSSASGRYQITDQTWKDLVARYGQQYGLTKNGKNDPKQQEVGANLLTAENSQKLQDFLGREPNPGELYSAHFLGAEGAKKLLQSANMPVAADTLFPKEALSNPGIFYKNGRPLTPAGVYRRLASKVKSNV